MAQKLMRILSASIVAILVVMAIPAHADSPPPSTSPQERAYLLLEAGQYRQAAIPLAEAGNAYIASGNASLGEEYLMLSNQLAQSDIPQYQPGMRHPGITADCLEAILALIAAIAAFDAACVSPVVVSV